MKFVKAVMLNSADRNMLEEMTGIFITGQSISVQQLLDMLKTFQHRYAVMADIIGPMFKELCPEENSSEQFTPKMTQLNAVINALKAL